MTTKALCVIVAAVLGVVLARARQGVRSLWVAWLPRAP
jgi:hypothetical protein